MLHIKKILILITTWFMAMSAYPQLVSTENIDVVIANYRASLNTNPKKAEEAAKKWLQISTQQNDTLSQARAHYALANVGTVLGDYKLTIKHADITIELLTEVGLEKGISACYNLLGVSYKNLGDYPRAMDNFLKCLAFAKKNENKVQQANAHQNIATLYILQKKYTDAAKNLDRAASLYRETNDDDGVLITLFNFANILKEQGRYEEALKQYQTVLEYRKKEGNKAAVAYVMINISQILVDQERYQAAIPRLEETLKLLEELHFNSDMAIVLNDLGVCESKLGNTQKAIEYYERSLSIGESLSLTNYNTSFYQNLSDLYEKQKKYKKALFYYHKAVDISLASRALDKEKYVAELQEKYETELKETKIKLLEKDKKLNEIELEQATSDVKKQRLLRNIFIMGFITLVGVLFLLRYFYLQRISAQKELAAQQEKNARQEINQLIRDHKLSVIERYQKGQEEERARLAREIHDGIGSDLAGIKIAFEHYLETQEDKKRGKRLLQAIDSSCKDVRALSHQLHPPSFSKIGFESFLKDVIEQFSLHNNLICNLLLYPKEEIDEIPEQILAHVYRIIQELLNNIAKHAKATEIEIQLTKHKDYLNLVVSDNGVGFTPKKKPGIGIRNIQERIEKLKGTIEIDSSAQSGTSIAIDIPVKID
ncbi:signal transduction histidine kinase [Mesonia hippocampi]|uniref:histidine kinase n=1 Tax=Mesonia hippocampi TaxID=1628250 RepID=A0A840ERB3_9FLAO|nr:tetratricopeptide repeat protein [Mesonia hippocampi]MBB4119595.1 signal transduction histidine kinase [Mesonia hippocampi]